MTLILIVRRADDGKSTWDGVWNGILEVDLSTGFSQQFSLGNARVNLGSEPVLYNLLTGTGTVSHPSSLYTDGALTIKSGVAEGTTFSTSFAGLYTDGSMPIYSAIYHFDTTPINSTPSIYSFDILYNHGIDEKTNIPVTYSFSTSFTDGALDIISSLAQDEPGIVIQQDVYSFGPIDRLPGFLGYAQVKYIETSSLNPEIIDSVSNELDSEFAASMTAAVNPENLQAVLRDSTDSDSDNDLTVPMLSWLSPSNLQAVLRDSTDSVSDINLTFAIEDWLNPEISKWVDRDSTDLAGDINLTFAIEDWINPEISKWVDRDSTDLAGDINTASFYTIPNNYSYIHGTAELLPNVDPLPITYITLSEGEETTVTNDRVLNSETIIETTYSTVVSKVLSDDTTYYDVTETTTPTYKYEQDVDYTQRTLVEYVTYFAESDPQRDLVSDTTVIISSATEYRFETGTPVVETYTILNDEGLYENLINTMEQQSIELISTLESRAESI